MYMDVQTNAYHSLSLVLELFLWIISVLYLCALNLRTLCMYCKRLIDKYLLEWASRESRKAFVA